MHRRRVPQRVEGVLRVLARRRHGGDDHRAGALAAGLAASFEGGAQQKGQRVTPAGRRAEFAAAIERSDRILEREEGGVDGRALSRSLRRVAVGVDALLRPGQVDECERAPGDARTLDVETKDGVRSTRRVVHACRRCLAEARPVLKESSQPCGAVHAYLGAWERLDRARGRVCEDLAHVAAAEEVARTADAQLCECGGDLIRRTEAGEEVVAEPRMQPGHRERLARPGLPIHQHRRGH
mmetsp:Transcript_3809/g.11237  ORF Transcript_3809/g.11237 Transcript_3809/m.11237 type:complete len:239 (+) Transcript_3809:1252-1968(+)